MIGDALLLKWGRVQAAILALHQNDAARAESEMKVRAPWTDRTAVARASLTATVHVSRGAGLSIETRYAHGVDYGVFLELAHGGKYAILGPTVKAHSSALGSGIQKILAAL